MAITLLEPRANYHIKTKGPQASENNIRLDTHFRPGLTGEHQRGGKGHGREPTKIEQKPEK